MNKLDFKNIPFFPPVFHITPDSDIDHLHQKQQYNKVYQKDRFYPFSKVNCDSCTHYYHHNAKDIPAMYGHSSLISLADSVVLLLVVKGRYKRPIYAMNCTTESAIYVMELTVME